MAEAVFRQGPVFPREAGPDFESEVCVGAAVFEFQLFQNTREKDHAGMTCFLQMAGFFVIIRR